MYVMVVGGGKVGYYLTKTLLSENHEVLLVEVRSARYNTLREELGDVVMHGDGCEIQTMEEAGARRADVVVAITGHDEDNLVICQMARKHFTVPRILTRINNPKNKDIYNRLGVESVISSTEIIYHMIEQQIPSASLIPLAALRNGDIEIIEVDLNSRSAVVGRAIRSLEMPKNALIISVIRGDRVEIPQAETVLQNGDTVIAIVHRDEEEQVQALFRDLGAGG
ncbi:MAG TPA: TrkA family potassium uptake protein [Armatimonadota bacterium]|jgi:trk system potassium uptake protein TrkA